MSLPKRQGHPEGPATLNGWPEKDSGLSAGVTRTQLATGKHGVIWCIFDLSPRGHFDDFQCVIFVGWVFFALHNQNVFETLVVVGAVRCWAITKSVKIKAFEGFANAARVEGARALTGVCIEQCLYIAGMC